MRMRFRSCWRTSHSRAAEILLRQSEMNVKKEEYRMTFKYITTAVFSLTSGCDCISVWPIEKEVLRMWGTEAFLSRERQRRKVKGTTNVLFIACSQLGNLNAEQLRYKADPRIAWPLNITLQFNASVCVRTTALHTMIPPPGSWHLDSQR